MGCLKLHNVYNTNLKVVYKNNCVTSPKTKNKTLSTYLYGFNGQEKDDEINGGGNAYDFDARIYDSRLGRFLGIDPLTSKYPYYSPYSAFANNPVIYVDNDGRENIVYVYDLRLMNPKLTKKEIKQILAETKAVVNKINKYYKDHGINIQAAVLTKVPTKDQLDKSDVLATIGSAEDHKTFDMLYSDRQVTLPKAPNKSYKYDEIAGDLNGNIEATTGSRGYHKPIGDDGDRVAVNSDLLGAYSSEHGVSKTDATAYTIIHGVITHTNKINHVGETPANWEANASDGQPDVTLGGKMMDDLPDNKNNYVKIMNTVGPNLKEAITRDGAHNTKKPAKVNLDSSFIKK